MPIIQHTLQDKAIFLAEPIATSKTVAIGFWFSVGSRFENSENHGISHFVEHMLFKGSKNYSCFDISCEFDKMGGYVNAFTERDLLCVHCVVPCQYCEKAIDIICEMVFTSKFDVGEIEKERTVIQSEIRSSLDDSEEVAIDSVFASVWKDNAIGKSIAGSVSSVESLTQENLLDWYERYIKNGKMVVALAGNFSVDSVLKKIEKFPTRKAIEQNFQTPVWHSKTYFINASFQQEQFLLSYPIKFPITFEKSMHFAILNAIIGDTMSSRLFQKLREESGFCYNVYSFLNFFYDCGFWLFYATSAKENSLSVSSDLIKIVNEFFSGKIEDEELKFAKQHLIGEEIMASEDVEQRMKNLARNYFSGFEMIEYEKVIEVIQNTKIEDLQNILDEFACCGEKSFVVCGPKLKKSVQKAIKCEVENWKI